MTVASRGGVSDIFIPSITLFQLPLLNLWTPTTTLNHSKVPLHIVHFIAHMLYTSKRWNFHKHDRTSLVCTTSDQQIHFSLPIPLRELPISLQCQQNVKEHIEFSSQVLASPPPHHWKPSRKIRKGWVQMISFLVIIVHVLISWYLRETFKSVYIFGSFLQRKWNKSEGLITV